MNYSTLLLALSLLVGCGVSKPIQPRQDPYLPSQIHMADEGLRINTAVSAPIVTRDPAGLLHVTLPIRAASDLQLYVDYRVTFFGPNRQTLSQTGWLTKTLTPNVYDQISVNSMSPQATDFEIDLRYAQ